MDACRQLSAVLNLLISGSVNCVVIYCILTGFDKMGNLEQNIVLGLSILKESLESKLQNATKVTLS